jgi:hypothetical protein
MYNQSAKEWKIFMRSLALSIRRFISRPYLIPTNISWTRFLQLYCAATLRQAKALLGAWDPLTQLAAKYKTDKGVTVFPFMAYTVHYDRLFSFLREQSINILEVGVGPRQLSTCPSLRMWAEYFPKANVYGFDIQDFSDVSLPRIRILQGDQGEPADLLKLVDQCPSFDIIIEDGSHASFHQQITLETLFPYLADGGLYVIEDLLYQPPELEAELPARRPTRELLKDRAAVDEMIKGVKDIEFLDSTIHDMKEGAVVISKRVR